MSVQVRITRPLAVVVTAAELRAVVEAAAGHEVPAYVAAVVDLRTRAVPA